MKFTKSGTPFGIADAYHGPKKFTVMKKLILLSLISTLLIGFTPLVANDNPKEYIGLPGDNLNLYAVMDLFQNSETLEGFERSLNDPETIINNLDLNSDNRVDYIMVEDYPDGNIHNIALMVALSKDEFQDVAVFIVEKLKDGSVQIQLIGDEALYGKNYIIEPNYSETPNPGYSGNIQSGSSANDNVTIVHTTYYEVASWPMIVYISAPTYRGWRSSWSWGHYPPYWNPWTPYYYHYYYGYHYNSYNHYYAYYRPWNHYRCNSYHQSYYKNHRQTSPTVIVNVNNGRYRDTYSRPERRRDGEVLYSHRASQGNTLPRRVSPRATPDRQDDKRPGTSARPASERTDRDNRRQDEVRDARDTRDNRNDVVRPKTETRERPINREEAKPKRDDRSGNDREYTRPAPARDVAKPSMDREKRSERPTQAPSQQTNPVRSQEQRATPARPANNSNSERKSETPNRSVNSSKNQNSRPAATETKQAPRSETPKKTETKTETNQRKNSERK